MHIKEQNKRMNTVFHPFHNYTFSSPNCWKFSMLKINTLIVSYKLICELHRSNLIFNRISLSRLNMLKQLYIRWDVRVISKSQFNKRSYGSPFASRSQVFHFYLPCVVSPLQLCGARPTHRCELAHLVLGLLTERWLFTLTQLVYSPLLTWSTNPHSHSLLTLTHLAYPPSLA